jgi:chromosome segregation ATPase
VRTDWRDKYHLLEKASFRQCGVSDIQDEPDAQSLVNMFEIEVGDQDEEYDENAQYLFLCPTKAIKMAWIESYKNLSQLGVKTKKFSILPPQNTPRHYNSDEEDERARVRNVKKTKGEKAMAAEIKDLKEKIANVSVERDEFKSSVDEKTKANNNMRTRVAELESSSKKFQQDLSTASETISLNDLRHQQELNAANEARQELTECKNIIEADLASVTAELTTYIAQLMTQNSDLERTKSLLSEKKSFANNIAEQKSILQIEKDNLESAANTFKASFLESTRELKFANEELEEGRIQLIESEKERLGLVASLDAAKVTMHSGQSQMQEKDIFIKTHESKLRMNVLELKQAQEYSQSLVDQINEKDVRLMEVEEARMKLANESELHIEVIKVRDKTISALQHEKEEKGVSFARVLTQLEERNTSNETLRAKLLVVEASASSRHETSTRQFTEKILSLESELDSTVTQKKIADERILVLFDEAKILNEAKFTLQNQFEAKNGLVVSLEHEKERLIRETESLGHTLKETTVSQNQRITDLETSAREKDAKLSSLESEFARASGQLDSSSTLKDFFEKMLADKTESLKEKERDMSELSARHLLASQNLNTRTEEMANLKRVMDDKLDVTKEVNGRCQALEARNRALESGVEALASLEQRVKENAATLTEKDRELSDLRAKHMKHDFEEGLKLHSAHQEIKQLENTNQAQVFKIAYIEEKIQDKARESEIGARDRSGAAKDQENLLRIIETSKRQSSTFDAREVHQEQEIAKLQIRLAEREEISSKRAVEIESLKAQHAISTEKLQMNIAVLGQKIEHVEAAKREIDASNMALKIEHDNTKRDVRELQTKLGQNEIEANKNSQEISSRSAENTRLAQDIVAGKSRIDELGLEKKEIKEKLRGCEEVIKSKDSEITTNTVFVQTLKESVKHLEADISSKSHDISTAESRITELSIRLANSETQASKLHVDLEKTMDTSVTLHDTISTIRERSYNLEREKAALESSAKDLGIEFRKMVEDYNMHIGELEQNYAFERDGYVGEISELKNLLVTAKETSIQEARLLCKLKKEGKAEIQEHLNLIAEKNAGLNMLAEEVRGIDALKQTHLSQVAQLTTESSRLASENEALSSKINHYDSTTLESRAESSEKTRQITALSLEITRLENLIESNKRGYSSTLKQKAIELESAKQSIVTEMTNNFAHSAKSLESLHTRIDELNTKLSDKEKVIEKLNGELVGLKGQKVRYTKFLSDAMEEAKMMDGARQVKIDELERRLGGETGMRQQQDSKAVSLGMVINELKNTIKDREASHKTIEARVDTLLAKNNELAGLNRDAFDRLSALPLLKQNLKQIDQESRAKSENIQELVDTITERDDLIREFRVKSLETENLILNTRIETASTQKDISSLTQKAALLKALELKHALLDQTHRKSLTAYKSATVALKSATALENKRCREVITLILVINEISRRLLDEPLIIINGENIAEALKGTGTTPVDVIPAIDEERLLELARTIEELVEGYEKCKGELEEREAKGEQLLAENNQLEAKITGANTHISKLSEGLEGAEDTYRLELQILERKTLDLKASVKTEQDLRKCGESREKKLKSAKTKRDNQFLALCETSKSLSVENLALKSSRSEIQARLAKIHGKKDDSLEVIVESLEREFRTYEDTRKKVSMGQYQGAAIPEVRDLREKKPEQKGRKDQGAANQEVRDLREKKPEQKGRKDQGAANPEVRDLREKKPEQKGRKGMEYMEQRAKADERLVIKRLGPMHRDLQAALPF